MFRKVKEVFILNKALNQYNEISKEIDNSMDSKHLFMSKTFWANILGLAVTVSGILPQKWAAPTMIVANIGLRIISGQPVTLLPAAPADPNAPKG